MTEDRVCNEPDDWDYADAPVYPIDDDADAGENQAPMNYATELLGWAEAIFCSARELKRRKAARAACVKETQEFLGLIEITRYIAWLYKTTAPRGVDYPNAARYADLYKSVEDLGLAALKSIGAKAAPAYPLPVTHQPVVDWIAAEATVLRAYLEDMGLADLIGLMPEDEHEKPAVQLAMGHLCVAFGIALHELAETPQGDGLLDIAGSWLLPQSDPAGEAAANYESALEAAIGFVGTIAAPMAGPDCLIQALLRLQMAQDILDDQKAMAAMFDENGGLRPGVTLENVTPTNLKLYTSRLRGTFNGVLDEDGWVEFNERFDAVTNAPTPDEQITATRKLQGFLEGKFSEPELNMPYDEGALLVTFAVLNAWVFYKGVTGFNEAMAANRDHAFGAGTTVMSLAASGFGAIAGGIQLIGLAGKTSVKFMQEGSAIAKSASTAVVEIEVLANGLGQVAAVFAVLAATFALFDAIERGDALDGLTSLLTLTGSLLLLYSALGMATVMTAAAAALVANAIFVVVAVINFTVTVYEAATDMTYRSFSAREVLNGLANLIATKRFTFKELGYDESAEEAMGLKTEIKALVDAAAAPKYFGMPPLFPMDMVSDRCETTLPAFEAFREQVGAEIDRQWALQKAWPVDAEQMLPEGSANLETQAQACASSARTLELLGIDTAHAWPMIYYDDARKREIKRDNFDHLWPTKP